jgi:hypothetical protein
MPPCDDGLAAPPSANMADGGRVRGRRISHIAIEKEDTYMKSTPGLYALAAAAALTLCATGFAQTGGAATNSGSTPAGASTSSGAGITSSGTAAPAGTTPRATDSTVGRTGSGTGAGMGTAPAGQSEAKMTGNGGSSKVAAKAKKSKAKKKKHTTHD